MLNYYIEMPAIFLNYETVCIIIEKDNDKIKKLLGTGNYFSALKKKKKIDL